jgi:hypothetical protein
MMKGLSPIISMVLTIMFGVVMVTLVLTVVNPTLDRAKDSAIVTEAFQNLPLLDTAIKEVASEAQGSKRTITISVSTGRYTVDPEKDAIYYEFEPNHPMGLGGTRGSIKIEEGLHTFDYFNGYGATADVASEWTTLNGSWSLDNYKYRGMGVAYKHIGDIQRYEISASISNVSGTGGEVYISPVHPGHLVGYWAMDNRTGTGIYDYSGHNNNGTLANMSSPATGESGWNTSCKFGGCLRFDGDNDYVDLGTIDVDSNELTLTAWFKADNFNVNDARIISKATGQDINNHWWMLSTVTSDGYKLRFRLKNNTGGTSTLIATSGDLTAGEWTYAAAVYDGSNMILYKNGVEVGSMAKTGSVATDNSVNVWIGDNPGPNRKQFNGTIDEVKVWDKALTADEVRAEYELSYKKIEAPSGSQDISAKTNATIVLVNPDGESRFDDIVTNDKETTQTFLIAYTSIDINTSAYFGQGDHQVTIEHVGVNSTSNRPIIQIS